MTVTKIAMAGGVVLLGFLCFLAAIGITAVTEGLVTLFALVVLVAGGNLLSGRSPYGARRPGGASGAGASAGTESQGPAVGAPPGDVVDRPEHGQT